MTVEQRGELIRYCLSNVDYDTRNIKVKDLINKLKFEESEYEYKPALEMVCIERFLMGFPVMIYTLKNENDYKILNMNDDFYKILAINDFMLNKFVLFDLKILTCCNGLFFKDLPLFFQRKLENYTVRAVEFYNIKDRKIISFLEALL